MCGGCWILNPALWTLIAPNGKTAQLSIAESRFVACLVARTGNVITREELLAVLGRPNLEVYKRNLDVTISRLRRKVETLCEMKLPLSSARGLGYVFNGPGEVVTAAREQRRHTAHRRKGRLGERSRPRAPTGAC